MPRTRLSSVIIVGSAALAGCAPGPGPAAGARSRAPEPAPQRPDEPSPRLASPRSFADCPDCPTLVEIPGGTFLIGSPATEPKRHRNESPQREVTISTFAMSAGEITREQYARFVADTDRAVPAGCQVEGETLDGKYETDPRASWRDPGFAQGLDHPVVCVSWHDARAYVAWLSRKSGHDYRLPSDAEWEYAARAGTTSAYFWGDDRDLGCGYTNGCDQSMKRVMPPSYPAIYAACDDGAVHTTPSRHYRPNAFGLYDMIGNAWEWVEDCTESNYDSLPTDGRPRSTDGCPTRDVRGGSWNDDPEDLRSATRHRVTPATREYDLGFRVARGL